MISPSRITRFEPDGPGGPTQMALGPSDFEVLPEAQIIHPCVEDKDQGMTPGVWDKTTMQEVFGPCTNTTISDGNLPSDTTRARRGKILFSNHRGTFGSDLRDTQSPKTELKPVAWHEFAQVLDGRVTRTRPTEQYGIPRHCMAGDVFLIPAGTITAWDAPKKPKEILCRS